MAGWLTDAQRQMLVESYLSKGYEETIELCNQFAVSRHYPAELVRKKRRNSGVKGLIHRSRDKMWERAIANGPVIA